MFRALVLILILMSVSSFVFSQANDIDSPEPRPEPFKFDEFEKITVANLKLRMKDFFFELENNPAVSGYIINYGTANEIAFRRKQIQDTIPFRRFDDYRLTIAEGGYRKIVKTELWIMPAGAKFPNSFTDESVQKITKPFRFEKLGFQSERLYKRVFGEFFRKLNNMKASRGFILVNADKKEFAAFKDKIHGYESFAIADSERVFFIEGNPQSPMTIELWFAPKGKNLPDFTAKANKIDEFGKLRNIEWQRRMKVIGHKLQGIKDTDSQLFIINYGTKKEITNTENLIHYFLYKNCRECFGYSRLKINYLRGGFTGKPRRVFWIVPDGANPPNP